MRVPNMREIAIDTEITGLDPLDGQPAWQQAVMQIAAELMRLRWDELIPEDFAQAPCDKDVRLCDIVYDGGAMRERAGAWRGDDKQAPATQSATQRGPVTDKHEIGRPEQHTMREIVLDTETTGLTVGGREWESHAP
jgi:hypothetical protein